MEAPANALLVNIDDDFLEQFFYRSASFSWSDSGWAAMSLWLGSGELSATYAGGAVGFNFAERRRVFEISDKGDGSENNSVQEAEVKAYTTVHVWRSSYFVQEGETLVELPTGISLGFGHVKSYQIRPNISPQHLLPEQAAEWGGQQPLPRLKVRARGGQASDPQSIAERVLSMSRLGGASAVARFVVDILLQLIELHGDANCSIQTKQQVWVKWSNEGTERKMAKIMEEDIGAAMNFLQYKALCIMHIFFAIIAYFRIQSFESSTLKPPESNAPL